MKKKVLVHRDGTMVSLGRDHHYDLMFCWRLKQGIKKNVDLSRLWQYVRYFWFNHLREHLSEEENLLFGRIHDDLSTRGYQEHNQIRRQIRKIFYQRQEKEAYLKLIDLLMAHIHYEEDVLFPHLENILPAQFLAEVSHPIANLHQQSVHDDYADVFW